jgi:hypothetical protein
MDLNKGYKKKSIIFFDNMKDPSILENEAS